MDIANISANGAAMMGGSASVPPEAAQAARAGSSAKAQVGEDSYAPSVASQGVAAKVAQLRADSSNEVREDLVVKFRALMGLGALDTPEAADRAATGMLSD
ncbi:MAG: hypothetical protein EXS14_10410 [Planctomycetes bacterium]|nr:hypothetical protein [Planctomycetota bacterium]